MSHRSDSNGEAGRRNAPARDAESQSAGGRAQDGRPESNQNARSTEMESPSIPQGPLPRFIQLAPLTSQMERYSPPRPRLAGVASILNPDPASNEKPSSARRRKAAEMDAPEGPTSSGVETAPSASSQGRSSPAVSASLTYDRSSRRVFTPRSPSLHRTASLGQLNPTPGTISARQAPFPVSPRFGAYTIEAGTQGVPPVPNIPANIRFGQTMGGSTQPESARGPSAGPSRAIGAVSEAASPTTSYSSWSQAEQASPAAPFAPPTSMPTLSATFDTASEGATPAPTGSQDNQYGLPMTSSGSANVYQMMTLETSSGRVQLPVDVQAASKVADEKRRRNAGASARFRQRRKEKERESSTTISRLEQQIKELRNSVDFYKRERDFMASALLQIPGGDRHFPRPPSPHQRSYSSAVAGPSGTSGPNGYSAAFYEEHGHQAEEHRNVRRRTSALSLPPPAQLAPPMQTSPAGPVPGPAYSPMYGPGYGPHGHHHRGSMSDVALPPPIDHPHPLPPPPVRHASIGAPPHNSSLHVAGRFGEQPHMHSSNSHRGASTPAQVLPHPGMWSPYAEEQRPRYGPGPGPGPIPGPSRTQGPGPGPGPGPEQSRQ